MMHLGKRKKEKSITWVLEFNYDGLTGLHIYVNAASKESPCWKWITTYKKVN